jgi:PAS domain S-box-containing protein
MNMKQRWNSLCPLLGVACAILAPTAAQAQTNSVAQPLPIEMSLITFLILGAFLVYTLLQFFIYKSRFTTTHSELQDIETELEHTRQRLTETGQTLNKTEITLKSTSKRYQSILFDAEIGMFQMDRKGKCTYINSAFQKMSGLYLKKAEGEGLQVAIHPDDRALFEETWNTFIQGDENFAMPFRFQLAKGREVYVNCRANKVLNEKKEVESYIGWVSNITEFHDAHIHELSSTARYTQFIEETVEGYFHLAPEQPIPLSTSADKIAEAIIDQMKVSACNESFATSYGAEPTSLIGKSINDLKDGCGPFKDAAALKKLISAEFKLINIESIRQDPRGNRLNLINNAIGIVEDNRLVGIWGSQRNISQQKREKEELKSQSQFMHRILDALPADVYVKDTRCRYLYASRKLAERTGIPQEDWIGKTIFEVMPATPRDHDKNAIEVMKNGKLSRIERKYDARNKSGWMETIQMPLVSEDELIEGVIGLSLETSERKKHEETIQNQKNNLDQQLQKRTKELQKSQDEHGKAVAGLRNTSQELRIREAELETQRTDFSEQLKEHSKDEETLRRSEENLLSRQKQLEDQLSSRLTELATETDKRKKWEELLAIKENELRKLEDVSNDRAKHLKENIVLREKMEGELQAGLEELEKQRKETDTLLATRQSTDGQLTKVSTAFQTAQKRIKTLIEQHAAELEHEVDERKTASAKLIQNAEELDELKHKFNERIEDETKALKQELAQKQVHEKALRQQGKDLEARIKDLEKALASKIQDHNKQVQEREGAEMQRQQIEQKMENMSTHQRQLVERQTQRLNLEIAEIRLDEIKLRKSVGDLEQEKETLQHEIKSQNEELDKSGQETEQLTIALTQANDELQTQKKDRDAIVAQKTQSLHEELKHLKQTEHDLLKQEQLLQKQGIELEQTIKKLTTNLNAESQNRETVEKELNELNVAFNASQDNVGLLIQEQTSKLHEQIKQHKKNESGLQKAEGALQQKAEELQKVIDNRTTELADAQNEREKAEHDLAQMIERSSQSAKDIEGTIASIKQEHLNDIQCVKDEQKELQQKEKYYRTLFQGSADAFLQIDLKSGQIRSANLAAAQLFGEETSKSLSGKTIDALSPDRQTDNTPSVDMAKARLHSALETGQETFEWQFLDADKKSFDALVSLSTIQIEESQLILAVVSNISTLKQQQSELQQRLAEAQEANRMNHDIVDEVTETIETSLHPVVSTALSIADAENLDEEQKSDLTDITRNCRTLIDTMHYRRELSHVDDGSDEMVVAKCDLHNLIKDVDQQFTHRAETKNIFFAVSYAQYQSANNVPNFVEVDGNKLKNILSILIGYALANTEKGRLGLHAIRKSDEGEMVHVAFELAYTGSAIKDDLLSQVFSVDGSDTVDMQYGLTLAQRYIRMLGGEIELEYRQGDTTALTLVLPCRKVASEILMPTSNSEPKAGAA